MIQVFYYIRNQLNDVIDIFFGDDMPVMSKSAQSIFAVKEDREKYVQAVENIKFGGEETITLANK
jgi:hypothetical protein